MTWLAVPVCIVACLACMAAIEGAKDALDRRHARRQRQKADREFWAIVGPLTDLFANDSPQPPA